MNVVCGSCRTPMEALALSNHIGGPVTIDLCWPCHMIWFDGLESTSLSAGSVIELFKRIHEARNKGRNTVSMQCACPSCARTLSHTSDLTRAGRFSYHRCPGGHGRLISFAQFLREKQFVRNLQPAELAQMKLTIKQIRCSSCGGPINLTSDPACTHCGAALAVLDEDAVRKALEGLQKKEIARTTVDPAKVGEAILQTQKQARREPAPWWNQPVDRGPGIADLVDVGIDVLLRGIFR
jgi:hypothetical protein